MEDIQRTAQPEQGQFIAIVFQAQPFGPDIDPNTKQMITTLNMFKGTFRGQAVLDTPPVSSGPIVWWLISDAAGSVVWRVKRDQIVMWTPMASVNQA